MPVSTEAPRCSEFARSIGVLPPGSGLFLSRVFLVSVPLPWPKPALNHVDLKAAAGLVVASEVPSRLFAAEPARSQDSGSAMSVEVYRRNGAAAAAYRWTLSARDALEPLIEAICNQPADAELLDLSVPGATQTQADLSVAPTFLICTQGTHDSCCGTSGVALADEIERSRPDYVVRRVSHTGGHRFSPTFLAFPEGRMWAYGDLALVDRIAQSRVTTDDVVNHGRGWWGARVGPAQVAETAVRAELTGRPFVAPVVVAEAMPEGSDVHRFAVTADGETWRVDVRVARTVPTIACESPGGLPVKPGREFAWAIELHDTVKP